MSIIYPMLCCSPHKESIDIGLLIVPAAFIGITTFLYKRGLISLGGRQLNRSDTRIQMTRAAPPTAAGHTGASASPPTSAGYPMSPAPTAYENQQFSQSYGMQYSTQPSTPMHHGLFSGSAFGHR